MKDTAITAAFAAMTLSSFAALPQPNGASFSYGAEFSVAGYEAGLPALSGFPVLVRLSEGSPKGFSYSSLLSPSTGNDLGFIDENGNGLPFEIDTWNPNGTSLVWVRLPRMENGTKFYACWGSTASGKSLSPENPWSGYVAIWHMNETANGAASIVDATDNALDGIAQTVSLAVADGAVGGARRVAQDNNHAPGIIVDTTTDAAKKEKAESLGTDFHASFWVRPKGTVQWSNIIGRRTGDEGTSWGFAYDEGASPPRMRAFSGSKTVYQSDNTIKLGTTLCKTDGIWKKLDVIWRYETSETGTPVVDIYYNGEYIETINCNEPVKQQDCNIGIGCSTQPVYGSSQSSQKGRRLNGEMDEVRLGAFVPSADWIAADYATQTSETFLSSGEVEAYEVTDVTPSFGIVATDFLYTNVLVDVTIGSLGKDETGGADAAWLDATLLVGTDPEDFSSPVFEAALDRVSDAPSTISLSVPALALGTTYYAKVVGTNEHGVGGESAVSSFATKSPNPVFTVEVTGEYLFPTASVRLTSVGFAEKITSIVIDVSTSADFSTLAGSATFPVDIVVVPEIVSALSVDGIPAASPLYYRVTVANDGGYSDSIVQTVSTSIGANNIWSGRSENIHDADAYLFQGGLPGPNARLYFTEPGGLSPVVNEDTAMPALYFVNGKTEGIDDSRHDGYHSSGYDFSGTGVLAFSAETPILTGTRGQNIIRNPLLFNRADNQRIVINAAGGRLDLLGELTLPEGVSTPTLSISAEKGEVHLGGRSSAFKGTLNVGSNMTLFLDNPNALTKLSRVYFAGGWGSTTILKNDTGAPVVFPDCTLIDQTTGWDCTSPRFNGAPFFFPNATLALSDRGGNGSINADVFVKNLRVTRANGANPAYFVKKGTGLLAVAENTEWDSENVDHEFRLWEGCFWPQQESALPPIGEIYLPGDAAWYSTLGLNDDFNPMLDGSSSPVLFQSSRNARWGFTGFGGDRTVCWNGDPSLNLTNTTSGSVAVTLASQQENTKGNSYDTYYAYPSSFVFGNRSAYADGTILFKNPIRYESGQDWDVATYFESTNHVVSARMQGSLCLANRNRTWSFNGRDFGGYLALEADNTDFNGRVRVTAKGNLLANAPLAARSVEVQTGSGLGGTGSVETTDGITVKTGGSLFGGEWNKGGALTIGGKVSFENGAALRVEVGTSNDAAGFVKLAPGATLSLGSPVYVDVDTDPRVSPVRGSRIKVLDWSEADFASGAAPNASDFVARPGSNSDLRSMFLFVREDGLYVSYVSVRQPMSTVLLIR